MSPRDDEPPFSLHQVYKDLYIGNGKPGLTTRMAQVEKTLDSIVTIGRWLLLTAGGILVVAIMNLIIKK